VIYWRRTIFAHLFLVFSAIVLAALTIFGWFSYSSMNDRLSSQAVKELLVLSRSLHPCFAPNCEMFGRAGANGPCWTS
jgi:hypothetical protein